ncbi:hypothetical protein [Marinococcus sp. PL1-022]|uniref:hypothetical protein n=1 Tax=Marinococcus sp. PL1-022 TaxID=3095363 RepID=UPI0029C205F6|nr:hypothetical protein [Marinococcus sp. PL1-022]MDX6152697.1 hypothetical protein [Marinococcus sp. PL1-022]
MISNKNNNSYNFFYSGQKKEAVRKEVEKIRYQYLDENESNSTFEKIKYMDKKVKMPAYLAALFLRLVGFLIIGSGISLYLAFNQSLVLIITGMIGIILIVLTYPIHTFLLKKRKEKYAAEIIELCNKLLQ